MALYFAGERQWHVGMDVQPLRDAARTPLMGDSVQADGDELQAIRYQFEGLPFNAIPGVRVQRWYGDHARFILGNIVNRT